LSTGPLRKEQRGPPNKASPKQNTAVEIKEFEYEPFDDGWPVNEEPFLDGPLNTGQAERRVAGSGLFTIKKNHTTLICA